MNAVMQFHTEALTQSAKMLCAKKTNASCIRNHKVLFSRLSKV